MILRLATSLITCILLISCANRVKTLVENQDCKSPVEGYFSYDEFYTGVTPVLFIKKDDKSKLIQGKIISQSPEGILFDQKKAGLFYDPEEKLYKYDEIIGAIDSSNNLIYGEVPKKYLHNWDIEIYFTHIKDPTKLEYSVRIKADHKFGFCLRHGIWEISKIQLIGKKGKTDEFIDIPKFQFKVEKDKTNYLGTIKISHKRIDDNSYQLYFTNLSDPGKEAGVGAAFGLVGSVLYQLSKKKYAEGIRYLQIEYDPNFLPVSKLENEFNPIHLVKSK